VLTVKKTNQPKTSWRYWKRNCRRYSRQYFKGRP